MLSLLGFSGVGLLLADGLLRPGASGAPLGYLVSFSSAVFTAAAMFSIRKAQAVTGTFIVLGASLAGLATSLAGFLWQGVHAPRLPLAMLLLGLSALFGTVSQFCMTWAMRSAPASRVAPAQFSGPVFSLGLGAALFAERLGPVQLAGAAMALFFGVLLPLRAPPARPRTVAPPRNSSKQRFFMATPWPIHFPHEPHPAGARPIPECPLIVFVGLTGVGKSTLLEALDMPLLPNRRDLVDRHVLPLLGAGPTADRGVRFELTRRYRQRYPGGLAHALAQGSTLPTWPLLFDGLRGEEEISYAREHLPEARYVVLEAGDRIRLKRLLGRGDAFDRVAVKATGRGAAAWDLAERLFCREEVEQILRWDVPEEELVAKLEILASERQSYSPEGPRRLRAGSAAALFVDTERLDPAQVAAEVRRFLGQP